MATGIAVADPEVGIDLGEMLGPRAPAGVCLVDVRSPREYAEDHIPGAHSVPLFDDQERAVVGTLYRHHGPEEAAAWGSDRVLERLEDFASTMARALELPASPEDRRPRVVGCARGGHRSSAVVRLLRERGHDVRQLVGGYRSWRSWVRETLATRAPARPFVMNGLTGSGKTLVLREVARQRPGHVIDLEGIARHRSSILGDIGLDPVSQKAFESELARALANQSTDWCLFEWEARKVGNRELPAHLYQTLHDAPHFELSATLEQRIDILSEEYLSCDGVAGIRDRLPALTRFPAFGEEGVASLIERLDAGDVRGVAMELLEKHYDPRYRHGHRDIPAAGRFSLTTVEDTARRIIEWIEERC